MLKIVSETAYRFGLGRKSKNESEDIKSFTPRVIILPSGCGCDVRIAPYLQKHNQLKSTALVTRAQAGMKKHGGSRKKLSWEQNLQCLEPGNIRSFVTTTTATCGCKLECIKKIDVLGDDDKSMIRALVHKLRESRMTGMCPVEMTEANILLSKSCHTNLTLTVISPPRVLKFSPPGGVKQI